MTTLKTCIRTITYLSDIGCLEIQGASLHNTFVSLPAKRADQDKEFHNDCFCHQKFHTKPIAALKPAAGIVSCAVR